MVKNKCLLKKPINQFKLNRLFIYYFIEYVLYISYWVILILLCLATSTGHLFFPLKICFFFYTSNQDYVWNTLRYLALSNNWMNIKHSCINEQKYQSEKSVQLFLTITMMQRIDWLIFLPSVLCFNIVVTQLVSKCTEYLS